MTSEGFRSMTRQEYAEEVMRRMLGGNRAAYRYAITKWKRARIAARLAEVQRRSLYRFDFLCAGCMDPQITAPIYSDWECGGDCYYRGRVRPPAVPACGICPTSEEHERTATP